MRTWTTQELAMINRKSVSNIRKWVRKGKIAHLPGQPDRFGEDVMVKLGFVNISDDVGKRIASSLKKLKANR